MSELPETVMADVTTIERWWRCVECEVTWRGASQVCWSCEGTAATTPDNPPPTSDAYSGRAARPTAGTPLTRHGSRRAG